MNNYQIIIEPVVTEKATSGIAATEQKYTFRVHPDADKIMVKQAIQKIFEVKVKSVNLLNVRGKKKRLGRFEGFRASWKKAVVTLAEGQTIELFGA